ncbi:MAG: glycosyltransferase family A protein [Planctomycetota bacterium]
MNVSVIIPVYNCRAYLAEAIDSVLRQTLAVTEVIVVDDGSTDGSGDVARGYGPPVRCVAIPHSGIGTARNTGVLEATGDYVAFLDADDWWEADKLQAQARHLSASGGDAVVFGLAQQFISPELPRDVAAGLHCPTEPLAGVSPSGMLAARRVFAQTGLFSTSLDVGEFIDWHARATEQGFESRTVPQVVFHRRIHTSNTGVRSRGSRKDYARLVKAALDRRRAAAEENTAPADGGADEAA